MVVIGQKWLYSGKSGFIRAEVVVLGRNWFYLGNSCFIRVKLVVFVQSGCN